MSSKVVGSRPLVKFLFDELICSALHINIRCKIMRLNLIVLFLGFLVFVSGCIQPQSSPQMIEKVAFEEWKPDGVIGENEYARSMLLQSPSSRGYSGGTMEISYKNDAEYLYLALNGTTRGWMSLGFEPSEWMKDADIIVGSVENGKATVLDEYCTGNYGPHENDTQLEGSYDIMEMGGEETVGRTVIELKRKMITGDKFDKAFSPGQKVSIIWAMADTSAKSAKHNVAKGEGIMALESGEQKAAVLTALTISEENGLAFIREEEKVSRDLYQSFYELELLSVFRDIARSEQSHMDSVLVLLDKYNLKDPVQEARGVFDNRTLQKTHDQLLVQGNISGDESLKAAATLEEISIMDLEKLISSTNINDIRTVYDGLLAGSQKHIRSYVKALAERKIKYEPKHLSQEEYDRIVKLP